MEDDAQTYPKMTKQSRISPDLAKISLTEDLPQAMGPVRPKSRTIWKVARDWNFEAENFCCTH